MRSIAFLFCSLVGYILGHLLLSGAVAAYTSSMVSYHLYLGILIFFNAKKAGVSLKPMEATFTHLAFLAVVVGLPYMRAQIPFFSVVSFFVPALAPFEVEWLFSKGSKEHTPAVRKETQQVPVEDLIDKATSEDHADFLEYMKQPNRVFRKHGRSVRDEFAYWLADRAFQKSAQTLNPVGQEGTADTADA